jgi:LmbE family N-acetylglucosaminyl deacetylase
MKLGIAHEKNYHSIDVTERGPDEASWRAAIHHATLPSWRPGRRGTVVVVSPHPDDETLALGGLLHDLVYAGWGVRLASITDGEAAYPNVTGLASIRQSELASALTRLGLGPAVTVCPLGFPDGAVAEHVAALAARLVPLMAGASWVLAPWPEDGHPDHEAAARAARTVAVAFQISIRFYPVWAWHWAYPGTPSAERMLSGAERWDLSPTAVTAKERAIGAFVSQREGVLGPPILPAHVLAHFLRPFEVVLA